MCDRIGISGMYDFICPTVSHLFMQLWLRLKGKNQCLSRIQWKNVNTVIYNLHHLIWGKYSSFIIKFNCCVLYILKSICDF